MKLNEKRKVIEVLLCGSDPVWSELLIDTAKSIGEDARIGFAAEEEWYSVRWNIYDSWEEDAIEAAYRLIESSPTLRREWFGR